MRTTQAMVVVAELCILTALLLPTANVTAQRQQSDWRTCDTCFRGFERKAIRHRFEIGGESPYHPALVMDSLNMTFGYYYGGPTSLARLSDSTHWRPCRNGERWRDSIDWNLWREAADRGFKATWAPGEIFLLGNSCRALEYYFDIDLDTIERTEFREGYGLPRRSANIRPVAGRFVRGVEVPPDPGRDSTLIAGKPRFVTDPGIGIRPSESRYYDTLRRFYGSLYADSSHVFDVTLTIHVADSLLVPLRDSDTIAYAVLYRREDTLQLGPDDCRCNWYAPFGRLAVTRERYQAATRRTTLPNDDRQYREIIFPIDFLRDSLASIDADGHRRRIYDTRTIFIRCDSNRVDTIAVRDSIPRYVVNYDHPLGWPSDGNECRDRCDSLHAALMSAGRIDPRTVRTEIAEGSDVYFDVYTTNKVPLTFLRAGIRSHLLTILERGDLDIMIRTAVGDLFADTTRDHALRRLLWRFAIRDEPLQKDYLYFRTMSAKVQRFATAIDPTYRGSTFANPYTHHAAFRTGVGDFDSLGVKIVGMTMEHLYPIGGAIPIVYANPDSMEGGRHNAWFGELICDNTEAGYARYTGSVQHGLTVKGESIREAVEVGRLRFAHMGPPTPVFANVQVGGWLRLGTNGYQEGFAADGYRRQTTPEEITAQTWMALNRGVNGLMYSDLIYDGNHLGVMHQENGAHGRDYDTLNVPIPGPPFTGPRYRIPKMWIGMRSNFNAIAAVTDEIRRIDSVYTSLVFDGRVISVDRSGGDFSRVPLVADVRAIRTRRYDPLHSGALADSTENGLPSADPIEETYLDLTEFTPSPEANDAVRGVRYLLVTNRRCWPPDTALSGGRRGLGAIDARRPEVRLNRPPRFTSDSLVIEQVGRENEWRRIGRFGEAVPLRRLKPGWGALYRIRPVGDRE